MTTAIVSEVHASAAALKAKVDTLQANQARVEQMLADLIANPPTGISADDMAVLVAARDLLDAESADVDADNADSPANTLPIGSVSVTVTDPNA